MKSNRWQTISNSNFAWEREALVYLEQRLPDHEPFRGWSNFEFIADDGSINEVDALVLGPAGLYLIEIKSRPGEISGDVHSWTWKQENRLYTDDNPLFLANRKAKKLASLLRRQKDFTRLRVPFIQAVIFCSASNNRLKLPESLANSVFGIDRGSPPVGGIIEALCQRRGMTVDAPIARAVGRALDQAGIRPANRARRVLDYTLERIIYEHPSGTYQDWLAVHGTMKDMQRMVRIYPIAQAQEAEQRSLAKRAAEREFRLLQPLEHAGILQVENLTAHDSGPALVFRLGAGALRLDHFMRERGTSLSFDTRLAMVRQIAEALKFAHEHKVAHRQLSPQSVFVVDPESATPQLKVYNWQLGQRMSGASSSSSTLMATIHADQFAENAASVYLAPEALNDPDADGETQDIFSLGALAYFIFSGQPPAATALETAQRVVAQRGLNLTAVLDGAPRSLCELVQFSTLPAVLDRTSRVRDFLVQVTAVEDEYTRPQSEATVPPLDAKSGDRLDADLVVKHRLGSGSTAVALLVDWAEDGSKREVVLKVASKPDNSDRIRSEFSTLKKLRHPRIVEALELRQFDALAGFLLASAGPKTLAQHLRDEGPLSLDYLERFGTDLIEAVNHLEDEGFPHRDIKPENIGIRQANDGREHLVLFDFSLSSVPADNIRCGTNAYLDPFLTDRKPVRWDSAAERYALALTLYEMATGDLPKWSQDGSHPTALANEIVVESERFDAGVRDELRGFFERALRRDFKLRFDNAAVMLAQWRRAFKASESVHPATSNSEGKDQTALLAEATLETHLIFLGISNRAANALDRAGLVSVRDFLLFPVFRLNRLRGVGKLTVRELTSLHTELRHRFPDIKASSRTRTTEISGEAYGPEQEIIALDLVAQQLLAGGAKGEGAAGREILRTVLSLPSERIPAPAFWPSQTDIAKALGVSRQRIGQAVTGGRERWRRNPSLTAIRDWTADFINSQGGATTPKELAQALLTARGSTSEESKAIEASLAVARAAVETELARTEPKFIESRSNGRVVLALTPELADYAESLGEIADELAGLDPLATPQRTLEQLRGVKLPDDVAALADNRLLQLAVAASNRAALSARGEIYPRGMEPKRVLQLAQGALFVSKDITIDELQRRVQARYPDASPLPPRPDLDRLLTEQGSRLEWVADRDAFAPIVTPSDAASGSSTTHVGRTSDRPSFYEPASPAHTAAKEFEERLRHSLQHGSFLVLMVPLKAARLAQERLLQRFDLAHRDFDQLMIASLKHTAERVGASWDTVVRADGAAPDSRDWLRLKQLVEKALPSALSELHAPDRTVLLTHPGLLARYDRLESLAGLSAEIGRTDSRLHGLWILLPCDEQNALPTLLRRPLPVASAAQWARIPESWLISSSSVAA